MLLEIIVQSVSDALAAEAGGADRLEVVREIDSGGLTPPLDLVRAIARATPLPLRVIVREDDGFEVRSGADLASLQRTARDLATIPVDGLVIGFTRGGALDLEATRDVLSAAPTLRATFHRAFDTLADAMAALDALGDVPQVDRVLTAGGAGDWPARCERLARYAARAGDRLTILAGGGIDEEAVVTIAAAGCVSEVHVGRAARESGLAAAPVSAERVRRLKTLAHG